MSSVENPGMTGGPPSAPSAGPTPTQPPPDFQHSTLKRPILIAKEYEHLMQEDEVLSDHLYDYSQLDVW